MKTPEELAVDYYYDSGVRARSDIPEHLHEAFQAEIQDAFLSGYAAVNRWISVEEELPTDDQIIIVLYKKEVRCAQFNFVDNQSSWNIWNCPGTIDVEVYSNFIKFWQPMPEDKK